jgi:hypothetical protein
MEFISTFYRDLQGWFSFYFKSDGKVWFIVSNVSIFLRLWSSLRPFCGLDTGADIWAACSLSITSDRSYDYPSRTCSIARVSRDSESLSSSTLCISCHLSLDFFYDFAAAILRWYYSGLLNETGSLDFLSFEVAGVAVASYPLT